MKVDLMLSSSSGTDEVEWVSCFVSNVRGVFIRIVHLSSFEPTSWDKSLAEKRWNGTRWGRKNLTHCPFNHNVSPKASSLFSGTGIREEKWDAKVAWDSSYFLTEDSSGRFIVFLVFLIGNERAHFPSQRFSFEAYLWWTIFFAKLLSTTTTQHPKASQLIFI